jgi:DNA-binding NarL/FixJ family response regulator
LHVAQRPHLQRLVDDLSPIERAFLRTMLGGSQPPRTERRRAPLGEVPLANMAVFQRAPYNLTPAQSNVMREVLNGKTNKEVGYALKISPRTVEVHRQQALEKLGVCNAVEMTRVALEAIEGRPLGVVVRRSASQPR